MREALADADRALSEGNYIAGFLSYESGYGFEDTLTRLYEPEDFPLLCLGVYAKPPSGVSILRSSRVLRDKDLAGEGVCGLRRNITRERYGEDIRRIREYIAAGDVYQITYCFKMLFTYRGDTRALYRELFRQQPVPYPAFVETADHSILSLSPELFIRKRGARIISKPMKGTWPRSGGFLKDAFGGMRLKFDPKNRAENLMIADLLRNDLGRIGSRVRAPKLFEVRRYRTLFQMTSTVKARVAHGLSLADLFSALFPSGSVTGAPKIRAMEVIRELEGEPRRIYTGAIGYATPEREMMFNIPIRTALLKGHSGEMGIGGGIVWDSTAEGEWQEGEWKSRFLSGLARRNSVDSGCIDG